MDLDARDRKLLCLLDQDARRPLSHLSKILEISKQAAGQRIMKLRALGIISSPYPIINPFSSGRMWAHLWVGLKRAERRTLREAIEFAGRMGSAFEAVSLSGAYDLGISFRPSGIREFRAAQEGFLAEFSGRVRAHGVSFVASARDFSHRVFAPEIGAREILIGGGAEEGADRTDERILKELARDGWAGAAEIGERAGIGDKTVYYRMGRMERSRVVLGYGLGIDYARMGYARYRFFLRMAERSWKRAAELGAHLRALPETVHIAETAGASDLEFEMVVGSEARARETVDRLRAGFPELVGECGYAEVKGRKALWNK